MQKISVVAVLAAFALVGCGGGAKIAPTKEAAAEAMYKATGMAGETGRRNLESLISRAVTSVDYECSNGGTASLSYDDTMPEQFTFTYNDCNEDGANSLDGSFTFSFVQTSDTCGETSCAIAMRLKGKVTFSGEISDFVDFDVTEAFSVTVTGNVATVTLRVDGWIKTSSGTYTYANEEVVVTGEIDQA